MKIIKMKNPKTTKKKWELEMNEKEPLQCCRLYKEEAKHNRMETQDNGFLLVIDGVRKEKERLTAAKLFLKFHGSCLRFFNLNVEKFQKLLC